MATLVILRADQGVNIREQPNLKGEITGMASLGQRLVCTAIDVQLADGYRWRKINMPLSGHHGQWVAECKLLPDGVIGSRLCSIYDVILDESASPVLPTPETLYRDGTWQWYQLDFTEGQRWLAELHLSGNGVSYQLVVVANTTGLQVEQVEVKPDE